MHNKLNVLVCIWMLFVHSLCYAQQSGSIKGKVVDNIGSALEYASVYLSARADTAKVLSGTITSSLGYISTFRRCDGPLFYSNQPAHPLLGRAAVASHRERLKGVGLLGAKI